MNKMPPSDASSRAIPIERKTNVDDLDKTPSGFDSTYDLATWRMYNRIVDHRQKHPVKASQDAFQQTSDCATRHGYHSSVNEAVYPMPVQHSDPSLLEGEIFKLEL
jgi:hypothetical protein